MNNSELTARLIASLSALYDAALFNRLAEFLEGELRVLRALRLAGRPLNPSVLSDELKVSRARITAALAALDRKGFVALSPEEGDRRRILASLTPAGTQYVLTRENEVERYFSHLVDMLGEDDTLELLRILSRAGDALPELEESI